MHKITKGLKKKKKGKKSKKGEEELFKPEELENYRKEHQGTSEEPAAQNEEWKKFLALTSEVDDILKKTQGDLDRIKSTSFFQRKPTQSEVRKFEEEKLAQENREKQAKKDLEPPTPAQLGIVEVSESESDEEEDDNIFDTTYIDALEAADVKLAYIPESPTEPLDGDDPFDTSAAEKAILGPQAERRGKKLVPLGAAVEVLTGRVQLPTCATQRPKANKRQILKDRDLLLQSFDETAQVGAVSDEAGQEIQKTLLDEDPFELTHEPLDLSNPIPFPQAVATVSIPEAETKQVLNKNDIISEFDVITSAEDDDDLEFEALAAESLSKTVLPAKSLSSNIAPAAQVLQWGAFEEDTKKEYQNDLEDDPFDTTFAEKVVPVVKDEGTSLTKDKTKDKVPGVELNLIKPEDRDLLGGSNSDLASSAFSSKQSFKPPNADVLNDDDFDPRADEKPRERTVSRPDVLNISGTKTVSFDLPSPNHHALGVESKIIKPLTPFYTRKASIPELPIADDPFDTSFASNAAPGKAELRIIENELINSNQSLNNDNFNKALRKIDAVVNTLKEISKPKLPIEADSLDLLATDNNIHAKVLTPGASIEFPEEIIYCDPFDTSIASNILPGKTELKLLETELIHAGKSSESAVDVKSTDLLVHDTDEVIEKPLSPSAEVKFSPTVDIDEDYDPFDTSCAGDIPPGKAELKLLELEFI